ncbi:hypothetical protein X760_01590 [Mesorhizobium sp. LSHC422A00]|nr:hypothetical protein X760_01590 [Mesorhizobium sp. LSHC422A00]ESZ17597.1 hypothetical protein X735_03545 [Mesorhizobium sp. L2C085B000]
MCGLAIERAALTFFHDAAEIHHVDALCGLANDGQIVRNEKT